jgi:hypothetical protein
VSRRYDASQGAERYWYGLKRTTREKLTAFPKAFCAFGLGTPERVAVLPYAFIEKHFDSIFSSPDALSGILHWHVRLRSRGDTLELLTQHDSVGVDASHFRLT